jgi:DNA topoisomerase VI subunit A
MSKLDGMTIDEAIRKGIKAVTRDWTRLKKKMHAQQKERVSQEHLEQLEQKKTEKQQMKAAAYQVMEQAYLAVSDNGKLPANQRQIMYQARPLIMALTDGKFWKDTRDFSRIIREFMADYPELTKDWDVVADARGHFSEPHMVGHIGIGTLEVRSYVQSWNETLDCSIKIEGGFPTVGPCNRYAYALFIEKEGFDPLLQRAQIAERYDLAIFSSKGQTNTATRQLVEQLDKNGVTIFRATDFDLAAISIGHWLYHSNETYQFTHQPKVIHLGLHLADINAMGLETEPQVIPQQKDPTEHFLEWDDCDLTQEELETLRGKYSYQENGWISQRVELNAMTARQFITWLENKLAEAGVKKVIPDHDTLATAWHRANIITQARHLISGLEQERPGPVPKTLEKQVATLLKQQPTLSWDAALIHLATTANDTKSNNSKAAGQQAVKRKKR